MENKTAEDFQWINSSTGEPLVFKGMKEESFTRQDVKNLMDIAYSAGKTAGMNQSYKVANDASLQCAEMKEEIEELQLYKHSCNESIAHLDRENKQLQEEVERLRGIINEAGIITGEDAERFQKNMDEATRKALPGKESRTDNP